MIAPAAIAPPRASPVPESSSRCLRQTLWNLSQYSLASMLPRPRYLLHISPTHCKPQRPSHQRLRLSLQTEMEIQKWKVLQKEDREIAAQPLEFCQQKESPQRK